MGKVFEWDLNFNNVLFTLKDVIFDKLFTRAGFTFICAMLFITVISKAYVAEGQVKKNSRIAQHHKLNQVTGRKPAQGNYTTVFINLPLSS